MALSTSPCLAYFQNWGWASSQFIAIWRSSPKIKKTKKNASVKSTLCKHKPNKKHCLSHANSNLYTSHFE
jgi:hypothetical protein